jgi:rod shape-determining protein MreD
MREFEPVLLGGARPAKRLGVRPVVLVLIPLIAILFQVYVPRFFETLAYLELPLLVTVYFALMKRHPIKGSLIGAAIGLAQDALSHHPLGLFGIVKTMVGYFAASVSQRFDVGNPALRFLLCFFFFLFHQFFQWVLSRALLGQVWSLHPTQAVIVAFLNALVAVPLFLVLDRLKEEGR